MRTRKTLHCTCYSLLAALFMIMPVTARSADFGKPGDPVHLVVGHPCCYTEVWSVMVLHGKDFWKKYLLAGSTVTYDVCLQGSTIGGAGGGGGRRGGGGGGRPAGGAAAK